jgi:hypothetical protein
MNRSSSSVVEALSARRRPEKTSMICAQIPFDRSGVKSTHYQHVVIGTRTFSLTMSVDVIHDIVQDRNKGDHGLQPSVVFMGTMCYLQFARAVYHRQTCLQQGSSTST